MTERIIGPGNPAERLPLGYYIQYHPNWSIVINRIIKIEDYFATMVQMGEISHSPLKPSCTDQANPCMAGAVIDRATSGIYVFHTQGLGLPLDLIALADKNDVYGGIVGGPRTTYTYKNNAEFFTSIGLDYIPPLSNELQSFALASFPEEQKIIYSYEA